MSANLYITPVKVDKTYLPCSAPSSFIESMKEAFCKDLPLKLIADDLPILQGMKIMARDSDKKSLEKLIEMVEKYGAIILSAEY